jgi:hypothetical protein
MSSSSIRRRRILALLLDALLDVLAANAVGLAATAALWSFFPSARAATPWLWGLVAAAAVSAFLLRDVRGGVARRWLGLEAIDSEGRPPGLGGSVRRNAPLLVPIWNLFEIWPVFRDGTAKRPGDRRRGIRVIETS